MGVSVRRQLRAGARCVRRGERARARSRSPTLLPTTSTRPLPPRWQREVRGSGADAPARRKPSPLWPFPVSPSAAAWLARSSAPAARRALGARPLLVVSHPDDEAMFFAPLLTACREARLRVGVLCLSTGDALGRGEERKVSQPAACSSGARLPRARRRHPLREPRVLRAAWIRSRRTLELCARTRCKGLSAPPVPPLVPWLELTEGLPPPRGNCRLSPVHARP